MKITIAGKERGGDIGAEIKRRAQITANLPANQRPAVFAPEIGALSLRAAQSDADYLERLVGLLRCRSAYDTLDFDMPVRPGRVGRLMRPLRKMLWKLLRYQHDRIAFRQNMINGFLVGALEFEVAERRRETDELRQRLERLEKTERKSGS